MPPRFVTLLLLLLLLLVLLLLLLLRSLTPNSIPFTYPISHLSPSTMTGPAL
jgi:hypothetical protein